MSRSSPALVPRRSTVLLLTAWMRLPGSGSSSPSSTVLSPGAHWSTATTSVRCTSPTRSSTRGPNMWRSIYTSSVIGSPSVMFGSSTSRPPPSSPTSSPRVSCPRPLPSFAPASTSPVASCVCGGLVCCTFRVQSANSTAPVVQTAGGVRVCVM